MNKLYKNLINILVALTIMLNPVIANAGVVSDFLDDVTAQFKKDWNEMAKKSGVGAGTKLQSGSTTIQSFGKFQIKPVKNFKAVVGFKITPPSLEFKKTDCGFKIDGYLGGIAFVNGQQIKKLLAMFTSKAGIAFIMHLALKIIAPTIEAVVQMLQKLQQIAALANLDACKAGSALADLAFNSMKSGIPTYLGGTSKQSECAATKGSDGTSNDPISARPDCKGSKNMFEFFGKKFQNNTGIDLGGYIDKGIAGWNKASKFFEDIFKDADYDKVKRHINDIRLNTAGPYNWSYEMMGGTEACGREIQSIKSGNDISISARDITSDSKASCAEVLIVMNMLGITVHQTNYHDIKEQKND